MSRYRIYLLSIDGAFIDSLDINCADDEAAIAELSKYIAQAPNLELWDGRRLVTRTRLTECRA